MKTKVKNSTAVLVGATGGIGKEIARQLNDAGYHLVLVGRNRTVLDALTEELLSQNSQVRVHPFVCDIAEAEQREALMAFVESLTENVDLLINNAGINDFSLFEQQSEEVIAELLAVNALYPLLLTRRFLSYFSRQAVPAQIVNVGSTFGSIAYPGFAAYCASKYALRGGTLALAREYADTPVRVRFFAPRATRTTLNASNVCKMNDELGVAMDDPQDVAREFLLFLRGKKTVMHLGWPEKAFVFVNKVLPGVVTGALKKSLPVIRRYAAQR